MIFKNLLAVKGYCTEMCYVRNCFLLPFNTEFGHLSDKNLDTVFISLLHNILKILFNKLGWGVFFGGGDFSASL